MDSLEPPFPLTRRQMLGRMGTGFGMLGLVGLLNDSGLLGPSAQAADGSRNPLAAKPPHFPAQAKHVIHIYLNGGPSQVDTFDPKPLLEKYAGKKLTVPTLRTERKTAGALRSPFTFSRFGKSGIEVSELFASTARAHIDDMCIVRSMYADVPNL